jgi:hypothetical protein
MIFVGDRGLYSKLSCGADMSFYDERYLKGAWPEIKERLRGGEDMIFLSAGGIDYLNELWIFAAEGKISRFAGIKKLPPKFAPIKFFDGAAKYLYVRPAVPYSMHGIDEQPRMDIFPLVADKDEFGTELGAVGLFLKNYDSSLAGGNYKGGCWYVIAAEDALSVASAADWDKFCKIALGYKKHKCFISRLTPEFALYKPGERVRIDWKIENTGEALQAALLVIGAYDKRGRKIAELANAELALGRRDSDAGHCYWYPKDLDGVYSIKASLFVCDRFVYGLPRDQSAKYADEASSSVLFVSKKRRRPKAEVDGRYLAIDGQRDFFVGTHYYPSSNFFELSYRPLCVERAAGAIGAMAKAGVKICRLWCDPVMDETSLRGMEALVELMGERGIVAEITFFSSWVRWMEINTPDARARFEAADMIDERLIGMLAKNMPEQLLYVAEMAKRWKDFSNIIWDFTNEASVVDPSSDQLDYPWLRDGCEGKQASLTNSEIFAKWGDEVKQTLRSHGAMQPVVYGEHCWDTGSENYRSTKNGDIIADHTYRPRGNLEYFANYQNAQCINKPFMIEEFGGVWPSNGERAKEYDFRYHIFFAAGHSAAINYEWGISWLCDTLSGAAPYMKFMDEALPEEIFVYEGRYTYGKSWPNGCVSVCPWVASPEYGAIYSCMDYESPTTLVMKRFARLGKGLAYCPKGQKTLLLLPFETHGFEKNLGYRRKTEGINEALKALWEMGAKFDIWQADELENLPKGAKTIICPNENEMDEKTKAALEAAEKNGAKIYCGGDMGWRGDSRIEKTAFAPAPESRLMHREIDGGEAIVIFNDAASPREYTVEGGVKMGIDKYGLFAVRHDLLQIAEFCGELGFRGEHIARSDMQTAIIAKKGESLGQTDGLTVLPHGPGEIAFAAPYTRCDVCGENGRALAKIELKQSGRLSVSPDMARYALSLHL